ncbi:cation:proton antiporter [candidate division WOR-3 bacterium]|nr:cation:proton antiporter [candidate division WOR-3 bacterium]
MFETTFFLLIGLGIFFSILRLIKGPTAPDRVVALDTLSTITTSLLVFLGFMFKRYVYLDVALVYALLTFIGAIVVARFLEKGLK